MKSEANNVIDRPSPCVVLTILLWIAMALHIGMATMHTSTQVTPTLCHTLDPNTAPWWELATLPRIGPATANGIVALRKESYTSQTSIGQQFIFQSANDLHRVRGIGPMTIRRIRPHLRFAHN